MVAALKTKVTSLNCYDGDSVAINYLPTMVVAAVTKMVMLDNVMAMVASGQRIDDGSNRNDDGNVATM